MYKLDCSLKICKNVLNFSVSFLRVVFSLLLLLHRLLSFLHCYFFFFRQLCFSHVFFWVMKIAIEVNSFRLLPCHGWESLTVGMNSIVALVNNITDPWQIGVNILSCFKFNVAYTTIFWII